MSLNHQFLFIINRMHKVLIIDDEPLIRKMLSRFLSNLGYDVFTAENGILGLEAFIEHKPQLVLLDLKMPSMGGIELLERLKPVVSSPYAVLILTGDGNEVDAEQCFELGVKAFLRKPVNLLELQGLVKNILDLVKFSSEIQDLNATLEQKVDERTNELKMANLQLQISYSELERVSKSFQLFVPNQFLNRIETHGFDGVQAGDTEEEKLTILFSDIRSFTHLSEGMTSTETFQFLNTYLGYMEPCITQNNGFIDKFIGDGIMALFDDENSAENAVKAALDMQAALDRFNVDWVAQGHAPILVGMAINTGLVRIGVLGSEHRLNSTVVGDPVNLTARLEELTKKYRTRILISQDTYDEIAVEDYMIREIDTVKVRGRTGSTTVYEIFDCGSPDMKEKKSKTMFKLKEGKDFYKNFQFTEAWECFRQCLEEFPEDVIALEYIKRCRYFQLHPPKAASWDGIVGDSDHLVDHVFRRHTPRFELQVPVQVRSHNKKFSWDAQMIDISQGGMQLEIDSHFDKGHVLTAKFFLIPPEFATEDNSSYRILSQIQWAAPGLENKMRLGLKFLVMPLDDENLLRKELHQLFVQKVY